MTTACPKGHDSEWPDWCSVCGERLAGAGAGSEAGDAGGDVGGAGIAAPVGGAPASGAAAPPPDTAPDAAPPIPTGPTCENCGEPRNEHDVFCESCGYDFAGGSLPDQPDEPVAAAPDVSSAAVPVAMHARVSVDTDFFAASVGDVELELPDPVPDTKVVPLNGIRILIGRHSTSRGIFPEIDVQALTGDPAVSSRHAMLERAADGSWTLTDLGSTNGTFLTAAAESSIDNGVALPIGAGSPIFIGAWTRIELSETTA